MLNQWSDCNVGLGYLTGPQGIGPCLIINHPSVEEAMEAREVLGACTRFQLRAHYEGEMSRLIMESAGDPIPIASRWTDRGEETLSVLPHYSGEWELDSDGTRLFMQGVGRCGYFFLLLYAQGKMVSDPILALMGRRE